MNGNGAKKMPTLSLEEDGAGDVNRTLRRAMELTHEL